MEIDILCPMCSCIQETTSHLFLHCSKALQFWSGLLLSQHNTYLQLFTVDCVNEWFFCWPSKTGNMFTVKVWKYLPYAAVLTIWKHRNGKIFKDRPVMIHKMQLETKGLVWFWGGN
ncbi:hypothetical protein FRX31_016308 [Thalictrum thalictroides]|uniref:Reverse transcriptase zinc-binding domain-containing protein n=1 Tax=Thalictrum thalictroides TaxID=46969 RepID=A0A7J6WD17_THATH|nr:hypothetical protein FRX31_016308 [Thalictrum thalictroides]